MIALIQRVFEAEVSVQGSVKSRIGEGLIVYIGIDQNDSYKDISYIPVSYTHLTLPTN